MHQQRTTAMFSEHWLHCPWNGATVTLNVQVNLCICRRTPAKGQIFHLFKWRIRHHRKRTASKVSKCRFSGKWWITVRPNKKIYVVLVTRPTLVFTPDPKLFFSSPELKAQVSYSGRLSVHLSVNLYIFNFFSRTAGPILTKLGTNHPWGKGTLNC